MEANGQIAQLEAATAGSVAGSLAAAGLEETLWFCPIEDRRGLDSSLAGMMGGLLLGSYAGLVACTGRLFRAGKASISTELAGIFQRLGTDAQMQPLHDRDKVGRNRPSTRRAKLTSRPVHQLNEPLDAATCCSHS